MKKTPQPEVEASFSWEKNDGMQCLFPVPPDAFRGVIEGINQGGQSGAEFGAEELRVQSTQVGVAEVWAVSYGSGFSEFAGGLAHLVGWGVQTISQVN